MMRCTTWPKKRKIERVVVFLGREGKLCRWEARPKKEPLQ